MAAFGKFPNTRLRRLRDGAGIRALTSETKLRPENLIWPLFVHGGTGDVAVPSMPGVHRLDQTGLLKAAEKALSLGIQAVALFPQTPDDKKDNQASEAFNADNLVCQSCRAIKARFPELMVITDVALDPYNATGHDGLVIDGQIANDESLAALAKQALVQAEAGSDTLAPSDMMDGRIGHIRAALDKNGFARTRLISYAAKYASAYYGPFRDAVGSSGSLTGDKKTYQMDPANSREALREVALDIQEGADIIMIKPGLPYLDIIKMVHDEFPVPIFAYQVSGEYAMIQAAAQNGWLDGQRGALESLICLRRAGASGILTYFAPQIAPLL